MLCILLQKLACLLQGFIEFLPDPVKSPVINRFAHFYSPDRLSGYLMDLQVQADIFVLSGSPHRARPVSRPLAGEGIAHSVIAEV